MIWNPKLLPCHPAQAPLCDRERMDPMTPMTAPALRFPAPGLPAGVTVSQDPGHEPHAGGLDLGDLVSLIAQTADPCVPCAPLRPGLCGLLDFLAAELQAFASRGGVLEAAARTAYHMRPVWRGALPPVRLSEGALCAQAGLPSPLARLEGRVPVWRVVDPEGAPCFLAGRSSSSFELSNVARAPNMGSVSMLHAWLLLAPQHVGLPIGPGLQCGCDDPRMLAAWFPERQDDQGRRLQLWLVDPAGLWTERGLQAVFAVDRAELLAECPLAEAHDQLLAAFDVEAGVQSCSAELMDMGFTPGGLHARWEQALLELILDQA